MPTFEPMAEVKSDTSTAAIEAVNQSIKSGAETQKDAAARLSEINHHWLARAKSEAEELTTLMQNLAGLKSPADAVSVWQGWFSGRVKRAADDGKQLLDDSKALMASVMPKH